jgi:hypothetical protein
MVIDETGWLFLETKKSRVTNEKAVTMIPAA